MIEEKIKSLLGQPIAEIGYRLIKVSMQSTEKRKILQIMAERQDYTSLSIEDCQKITKLVSAILEEENIISGAYNLEVSSPGLDRPLLSIEDFRRYEGFLISVKSRISVDGSRKFKGRTKLEGEKINLFDEKGEKILDFGIEEIDSAKIVITDELFKTKGKIN